MTWRLFVHLPFELCRKFIQGEIKVACANGETRALKLFVDWRDNCVNGEHLWIYVGSSSEACYVGENECLKHGPRLCCSACKITAHTGCISVLIDKIKFICKHTFRDLSIANPPQIKDLQQQNVIYHHWVHKRTHCGKCKQCTKTFGNTKLPFSSKEIQAITCSWCKISYHNKENCYTLSALTEPCTLGAHRESIIPPPWILKLPMTQQPINNNSIEISGANHVTQDILNDECLIDLSALTSPSQMVFKSSDLTSGNNNNNNNDCTSNYNNINLDNNNKENNDEESLMGLQSRRQIYYSTNRNTNPHYQTYGTNMTLINNFRIVPLPIQGVPNAGSKPVLVFVNPRSGGNQGAKVMQKFNWLLNPRQVFDLIESGGPRTALELYRDVPNLRILTIGGDGTASWILSHLDEVGIPNRIPVAVLPLGTGNDLARALGWGGGYTDEPVAKILTQVRDGEVVQLDRWNLQVERNFEVTPSSPSEYSSTGYSNSVSGGTINMDVGSPMVAMSPSYMINNSILDQASCDTGTQRVGGIGGEPTIATTPTSGYNSLSAAANSVISDETGSERLPMDVINNYFSFGVDAHIALEFHNAREAHPERFNSRLRNKMFYGQAGGKDLLKRKWKDLSNFVTLYCDGQDITGRLKELKVHSVLFLNIPSYGGGTRPWPTTATSFARPRTDDGLIEVIGLTTYQLPLLQAGGHGTCIAQCRNAKIITSRTIPMQVDGEPCKLLPSIINISFKNRVCMLAKSRNYNKA